MKHFLLFLFVSICCSAFAQQFPQAEVNTALHDAFQHQRSFPSSAVEVNPEQSQLMTYLDQASAMRKNNFDPFRIHNNFPQPQTLDTLIVGLVPNDTLRITGAWNHTGPIWVLGTGVLIFHNAIVHDTGDVIVFQDGKWFADSSAFYFPQNYFYERSFLVVQNGMAQFDNCSTNYSGMSHGLTVAGNASMTWNNMHNDDWTTCGLNGHATMNIHNCNVSGEYILYDTCTANFIHADTIILWHQMPATAVVNYSFPSGNPVYNYDFNNSVSGVTGLNYSVHADSCVDVMWALMPVNGSDVTLSNSTIRLIGAWFTNGDVTTAHGIFNNSVYTNYVTPLADRNLHLINSSVQTWSMYVFDSSIVAMDSCQFGEIGTQQTSLVTADNVIADGTGGYFWSTDSSAVIATNCISYNTCRAEKKSLFILAYSWLPFVPPTAIANGNIISVQNTLAADPVPYDGSVAWLNRIDGPDTSVVNSIVLLSGSAWINQGPLGNPVDFASYSLYWQNPAVSQNWYPIVVDSATEVAHSTLANWNTNGLTPGTYVLAERIIDNFNDTVDGYRVITLLSNPVGVENISSVEPQISVYPNPFCGSATVHSNSGFRNAAAEVVDLAGRSVILIPGINGNDFVVEGHDLAPGNYLIRIRSENEMPEFVRVTVQ